MRVRDIPDSPEHAHGTVPLQARGTAAEAAQMRFEEAAERAVRGAARYDAPMMRTHATHDENARDLTCTCAPPRRLFNVQEYARSEKRCKSALYSESRARQAQAYARYARATRCASAARTSRRPDAPGGAERG